MIFKQQELFLDVETTRPCGTSLSFSFFFNWTALSSGTNTFWGSRGGIKCLSLSTQRSTTEQRLDICELALFKNLQVQKLTTEITVAWPPLLLVTKDRHTSLWFSFFLLLTVFLSFIWKHTFKNTIYTQRTAVYIHVYTSDRRLQALPNTNAELLPRVGRDIDATVT